jgi:hypothetical protein
VHISDNLAGIVGAFSSSAAILRFGNNSSVLFCVPLLAIAAICWLFISSKKDMESKVYSNKHDNYFKVRIYDVLVTDDEVLITGTRLFGLSVWNGGKLIFTKRRFIWLLGTYTLALYAHQYVSPWSCSNN